MDEIQEQELKVDEHTMTQLSETARWSRLLGVAGIMMGIFFLFLAMTAGDAIANLGSGAGLPAGMSSSIIAFMYLIMGLVAMSVSFYLLRFGNRMKVALNYKRQDYFNHAFHSLKMAYRILGILLIAYFSLSLISGFFMAGASK